MMKWAEIKAGAGALAHIREKGLTADDISTMLGASGGPKWFILQGLDNYLFGDFFAKRSQPLNLLGTSAGGWRFASLGRKNAAEASALFSKLYRATVYTEKPDIREITDKAIELLHEYVPDSAVTEILEQDTFMHHMIAVRCKGLNAASGRLGQGLGLLKAAGLNMLSRKTLGSSYERVIFHHPKAASVMGKTWADLPTIHVPLNQNNFHQALLATGSIPMVLDGVRDIPGAPPGVYRDGGVTDYHFDVPLNDQPGLVLYPHFQREVIPGWFDKNTKRRTTGANWPNTVLITPTQAFIDSLPYGKIPDRYDFAKLDVPARQKFWQEATDAGYRLAEEVAENIATGRIKEAVQPW